MFKVISLNVNGLRSALTKGLWPWLARQRADVVCLQETRLGRDGVPELVTRSSWHGYYCSAQKLGYSGTAILSRRPACDVQYRFGTPEFDDEGRYCAIDLGGVKIVSLYAPSGSSGPHRQASKDRFMRVFKKQLGKLARGPQPVILCGDINIAHTQQDLRNWSSNKKNSGFLPHERAWLDEWVGRKDPKTGAIQTQTAWSDVFRLLNQKDHQYTWWSNRGQAWQNNVGWRIDYQIATKGIAHTAKITSIYLNKRFSDHAPLVVSYEHDPFGQAT